MPTITQFTFNAIRTLIFGGLGALLSFGLSPFIIKFLYKIGFWKKMPRDKTITGEKAEIFYSLHKERETRVPRGGGLLIWISVATLILIFFILSFFDTPWWFKKLNFLSRRETWLPFFTLVSASLVGLVDDALVVYGKGKYAGKGLSFTRRLFIVFLIGLIGGTWFFYKLEWRTIHLPLVFNFPEGLNLDVGFLIIPLYILVMIACWAGGVVDGIDGLAGGVFASIFGAFSIIAFAQHKPDLAAFCAAVGGTLFAFLWHNIPPAKFYMGETGVLGLTSTMAVIAFLTDSVTILPLIAGIMVIEVGSIILQLLSKKIRKKKIWLSTPIHHHLEAKGWLPHQITMRFWVLSVIFAILGVAIRLLG